MKFCKLKHLDKKTKKQDQQYPETPSMPFSVLFTQGNNDPDF